MNTRLVIGLLCTLALSARGDGWRFTIPPDMVDRDASVASPGSVPPTVSTNGNLEIIGWSTSLTPTPEDGEFVLKLRQAMRVGTVLYYGPGQLSGGLSNDWRQPMVTQAKENRFSILPFLTQTDSVRITGPATRQSDNSGYKATVPFLTFLPVPATNVIGKAKVQVSGGNPELVRDRLVGPKNMFHASPEKGSNAWVELRWPKGELVRGIGLFGGPDSTPLKDIWLQYIIEKEGKEVWRNIDGRPTEPGQFCANQFFIAGEQLKTKAVRLSRRATGEELVLSEIIVLQDLRK